MVATKAPTDNSANSQRPKQQRGTLPRNGLISLNCPIGSNGPNLPEKDRLTYTQKKASLIKGRFGGIVYMAGGIIADSASR